MRHSSAGVLTFNMLSAILFAVLLQGAWGEDRQIPQECNPGLLTHYEEAGCTPVFGSGPCPIKYDCSLLQSRTSNKCYIRGNQYEPGARIGSFNSACRAACFCQELDQNSTTITCAQIECPEMFNPSYRHPGCISQYSIDHCCSESEFCPNATKNTTDITCEYQGSILIEGQKFYPNEEPCTVCVCQQGFDGTLKEPWCRKIFCGIELHHGNDIVNGCAPVYYGNCCPVTYRCPQEGDQVRQVSPGDTAGARTSEEKCVYGSLQLNVGDKLDLGSDNCTECTCNTPPTPTCMHKC